ncbi:MAG: alanine dehydrogenase [bacterium]
MRVGIPKEIKDHEGRVALLPEAVAQLVAAGHQVLVQRGAGAGSGHADSLYRRAGAELVAGARPLYARSEMVVKVKEPLPKEFGFFRPGLRIFCFLHLAANPGLVRALCKHRVTALAFETLVEGGTTPLLRPMSEIAGRLSVIVGAHYLQSNQGGRGVLLSPTDYSEGARVTIVGCGSVGRAAAEVAAEMGARVHALDLRPEPLAAWAARFSNLRLEASSPQVIAASLREADLAIGAIYIPGAKAPKVIRRAMVRRMEPGAVLVDVSVDQGGASETTRPTSHSQPVYRRYGVIHYAVPNMPALVSRTASQVLSRAVLPYVKRVAALEEVAQLEADPVLRGAINVRGGEVTNPAVLASL